MALTTDAPADGGPQSPPPRHRRRLDTRTIVICSCIALVVALLAAVITSAVTSGHHSTSPSNNTLGPLTPSSKVDRSGILTAQVQTYAGRHTTLAPRLGRPTVVNLWSSTCYPCIREMPAIDAVYRTEHGAVGFVGIDVEESRAADGQAMVRRTKATYPMLWDRDSRFLVASQATALPTTLFLDASGKVRYVNTGALTAPELRHLIATKLH